MKNNVDKDIARRVQKAFAEDLSSFDEGTKRKLQAARYHAVENKGRDRRSTNLLGKPAFTSGLIFTCSVGVVAGVLLVQPPPLISDDETFEQQAVLYQADENEISPGELELVEELEFYEWLESNGYAG